MTIELRATKPQAMWRPRTVYTEAIVCIMTSVLLSMLYTHHREQ